MNSEKDPVTVSMRLSVCAIDVLYVCDILNYLFGFSPRLYRNTVCIHRLISVWADVLFVITTKLMVHIYLFLNNLSAELCLTLLVNYLIDIYLGFWDFHLFIYLIVCVFV